MKRLVLAMVVLMMVLSSKGRVAWYGEREFESTVASLEQEGYIVHSVGAIDENTLSLYDVLVVCLAELSPEQKDAIAGFVEKGGGLLVIYDFTLYPEVNSILSEYSLEKASGMENELIFSLLSEEVVNELKKRVGFSQKGRGRVIMVGYDPLTSQALSLLRGQETIFILGLEWLCQDWHVEQTENLVARQRLTRLVPVVVVAALLVAAGYVIVKRKKKLGTVKVKESVKEEQIRELKARFVYGELSRDEYQQELERLEGS